VTNACTVKRQAFSHVEVIKDSTHSSVDTSYHAKEVSFEIESEDDSKSSNLILTQSEFDYYIDSLFAEIDTACDKERLIETITKTKGLWNTDTSYLETSLARSHAVVKNGKLSHFLHQKDTTITKRYDSLLQVIEKEREIWHSKEVLESSEKITRSGFNFKIIAIIIIILVLAWIIIKRLI
jgi:hypothetical protein